MSHWELLQRRGNGKRRSSSLPQHSRHLQVFLLTAETPEPKFIVIYGSQKQAMGWVKVGSDLGLPMLHKCLFKSALTPSLPPPFLFVVLEINRQIQMCSTNRRDLSRSTPFPL